MLVKKQNMRNYEQNVGMEWMHRCWRGFEKSYRRSGETSSVNRAHVPNGIIHNEFSVLCLLLKTFSYSINWIKWNSNWITFCCHCWRHWVRVSWQSAFEWTNGKFVEFMIVVTLDSFFHPLAFSLSQSPPSLSVSLFFLSSLVWAYSFAWVRNRKKSRRPKRTNDEKSNNKRRLRIAIQNFESKLLNWMSVIESSFTWLSVDFI